MKHLAKVMILFCIGGSIYVCIEMAWRGRSHPAMFVVGGMCFLICGAINEKIPWEMPLWKQGAIGAALITAVEFTSGCILNLWLGLGIWDYSGIPGNILGQICLPFSIAWFVLAIVAIILDDYLRYRLFGEEKPHYILFKTKGGAG